MTVNLNWLTIINHLLDFFFSYTDNSFAYSVLRTVTVKLCWYSIKNLKLHIPKNMFQNLFRSHSFLQHGCNRLNLLNSCLKLIYKFIRCSRHKLDNKSSSLLNSIILIHKNAKSYRRWNLLTVSKIISKVICNLTCNKNSITDIWLFKSNILNYA